MVAGWINPFLVKTSVIIVSLCGNVALLYTGCQTDCEDPQCAETKRCWEQLAGHWYPGIAIMGLAFVVWYGPSRWSYTYINCGMVAFGGVYIVQELIVGGSTSVPRRTIQHLAFTAGISCIGMVRILVGNCIITLPYFKLDVVTFAIVAVLLVVFMMNHPQPNPIGDSMHNQTGFFVVAFWTLYVFRRNQYACWSLLASAVSFITSQYGLTQLATKFDIDVVAYDSIVCVLILLVWALTLFLNGEKVQVQQSRSSFVPLKRISEQKLNTV